MTRLHQAEVSKAEADANIERKLNVLKSWLSTGIPYRQTADGETFLDNHDQKILDFYPRSLRQFKIWDGSQNCESVKVHLPVFAATGNDTLAKRPALEEQARQVIAALRLRAESQSNTTRQSEIKRLKSEIKVAEATIEMRNAELREQQRTLRRIERTNIRLNQKIIGDAAEFKKTYKTLSSELEKQKLLNSQLTAQLVKVAPLRQVDAG
ncbi:hypothetical protein [Massilia timonae]|uniref:hypothetical protein n=1 Tax=Massilia timonae TaxID=47229 RepID=UPI0023530FB9|nr:hypothetical protein [Massilia timonae]